MKRTTISLPDEIATLLDREARRQAQSVSEIARRALAAYFGLDQTKPRALPFADLGHSGYTNTAQDFEEVLAAEWDCDRDR
jgi:metal-responsive CopG/Arc/MetJ family transcriptional regulator